MYDMTQGLIQFEQEGDILDVTSLKTFRKIIIISEILVYGKK